MKITLEVGGNGSGVHVPASRYRELQDTVKPRLADNISKAETILAQK
jgi:hypothetical protein